MANNTRQNAPKFPVPNHSTASMSSFNGLVNERSHFSGAEDEFTVDDSATVLEKIAKIYAERLLCDITLVVGGHPYPAHRLILCASSDVFQVMLMSPSWSESQETTVILQEDPACANVFADFLKYLYTGKIHINHYSVLPLLSLADKYNVKDLIHLCLEYMQCHLVSAAAHSQLIAWLQYTSYCGHEKVASACQDFVKWNFEMIAAGSDFVNMEPDVLLTFLQSSDLVVYHEMALFQCVARWLDFQELRLKSQYSGGNNNSSNSSSSSSSSGSNVSVDNGDRSVCIGNGGDWSVRFAMLVTDVMSHVRFPMLSPRQLAELLLSPLITRFHSFFFDKMADAMSFHSRGDERIERLKQTPEGRLHLTPRLYTTETWGAMLAIENFLNFPTYGVRTLLFSSPSGLSESEAEPTIDWSVDLYPKGVWFKKLYLIAWHGTVELPETTFRSIRLSVSSRTDHKEFRTSVGILLYGVRDGVEYVRSVVQKKFVFTSDERVVNIDHLMPYDDLNGGHSSRGGTYGEGANSSSAYLIGSRKDMFKIHVILLPTGNA